MKWEYMLIEFHGDTAKEIEDRMERRGAEGWELVAVSEGVAYMKRPKQEVS